MKFYLILNFICYLYLSISTTIKPELKKNILNFGHGIIYKYEGMLAFIWQILHSNKIYATSYGRYKIFLN